MLLVLGAGVEQLGEGILPVHRHDLLAHLVGRAVERKREAHLQRLLGELADARREAAGGNRDVPRADADAPMRVDDLDRLHQVGVIRQRLAHAHEDDVVDLRLRRALGLDDLRDDLARRQVALEALQPARAELAAVGAADLGRNAEREPVRALAEHVERRGNQHALDVIAGAQLPEQFPRRVVRALQLRQLQRGEIVSAPRAAARSAAGRLVISANDAARFA